MHRTLRYRLENVFPKLKEDMVFANLAAPLIQHCLITDDEYEALLALTSENDRSVALLDCLFGKTDSAYYTFLEILKVDHPWIMDEILNVGDGDVVDGNPLPRPTPAIIKRNDLSDEMSFASTSRLKRSGSEKCVTVCEPPSAKRRTSVTDERSQIVKNSVRHPGKINGKIVNKRTLHSERIVKEDNCKCSETRCTFSNSAKSGNELITNPVPEENNTKNDQGLSEDMISIVKKNYRVCTRWTSLAHSLGLSSYVDKIQFKVMIHNEDLDLRVVYLLREWLGERSKDATLNNLLIALRNEGFNDVADELDEKFSM